MSFDRFFKIALLVMFAIAVLLYATDARRWSKPREREYWFTKGFDPPRYAWDRNTGDGYRLYPSSDNITEAQKAEHAERRRTEHFWLHTHQGIPSDTE